MKKLILLISVTALLSGCAEFKVISSAAFNELNADVVSVEMAAYQAKPVEAAPEGKPKKRYMANADLNPFLKRPPKYDVIAKVEKGLWEK